ncbi:MAG: hypothetical protein GC152_00860 [Alphaproteobacteria bacterium]|nr:hypothetical protein [Alphaproteobacteria bacterium]
MLASMMPRIAFVTCLEKPAFQPSDRLAAEALAKRGVEVSPVPWNANGSDFEGWDAIVVRSTWDYVGREASFLAWLLSLDKRPNVYNPSRLMRWNLSKRYLARLGWQGVPIVPTRFVAPSPTDILVGMEQLGLVEAVVKPVFGASGIGLSIVRADDPEGLLVAAAKLRSAGMVQPVLSEIGDVGETSFVFFDGIFSHAINKRPAPGAILCQEEHGGVSVRLDPAPAAIEAARNVLDKLPIAPLYARIDAIVDNDRFMIMEAELIEPELFIGLAPTAADVFADAIMARLR